MPLDATGEMHAQVWCILVDSIQLKAAMTYYRIFLVLINMIKSGRQSFGLELSHIN